MVLLVSLVPVYLFLPDLTLMDGFSRPEIALDRAIPLVPVWAFIYGAPYLFLIVLPVLVVRQEEHIARTVYAYLMIWMTAYMFFVIYPTEAPRPDEIAGEGFAVWGLRLLYDSDPPYNCFPSLHVAHSFVSALTIFRVHRRLGIASMVCAGIVALSTLFTKQHYVVDVVAGILLALAAYAIFLQRLPRETVPELDRAAAPVLAAVMAVIITAGLGIYFVIYKLTG
jgi:membrane-associated phospholipid phosphatase